MVILIEILTPVVYLIGARGTFGFLKRKDYGRILHDADKCQHGYTEFHRGAYCHPVIVQKTATQIWRSTCAFIWPVWMPLVFIYKVVTARW